MRAVSVALLAAVLLTFGYAGAQSQPPSPSPAKPSQEPKTNPKKPATQSGAAQQESNRAPLTVTINGPVTVEKSQKDHDAETKESEGNASREGWLVIWTGALALITLALAGITGVLARYTYKLWKDGRENLAASRRAWIQITNFELREGTAIDNGAVFMAHATFKNVGQSPASNLAMEVEFWQSRKPELFSVVEKTFKASVLRRSKTAIGPVLFPNDERAHAERSIEDLITIEEGAKHQIFFFVAIGYKIVSDPEPHITYSCYYKSILPGLDLSSDRRLRFEPVDLITAEAT